MDLFASTIEEGLHLARRVDPKYAPVWQNRPPEQQAALAMYFLPHRSRKAVLCPTRPRVIKWYCPFAHQRDFPSGHRYCINVYVGCAHACEYCYAASYEPHEPAVKRQFERMLTRDLADLERLDVPPAPVHLSNSTDPFQPLEATTSHTRLALQQILNYRRRFTTVVVLTKNPQLAVDLGCIDLFRKLASSPVQNPPTTPTGAVVSPAFLLEVSLTFWREEARRAYDPGAPSVESRMEGIRQLRQAGVPVVLRVDPLFPRLPMHDASKPRTYSDFGLPEPQTREDLERLAAFAAKMDVLHVVYSPAKIVQPRTRRLSPAMRAMRSVYEYVAAPRHLAFRGGSWRLPSADQDEVTGPFRDLCRRHGVRTKCCKQNLIETP